MKTNSIIKQSVIMALVIIAIASGTYEGILTTGIVAIGGETTGATLKTRAGAVYQLDFGKNAGLARMAETLGGKMVLVTGELKTREGVETGEHRVIAVTSLKESTGRKP
jgi:hypothetical protein